MPLRPFPDDDQFQVTVLSLYSHRDCKHCLLYLASNSAGIKVIGGARRSTVEAADSQAIELAMLNGLARVWMLMKE